MNLFQLLFCPPRFTERRQETEAMFLSSRPSGSERMGSSLPSWKQLTWIKVSG